MNLSDNEEDEDSSETTSWKSPSMSESTPREGRSSAKRQAPRALSQSPLTPLTYHHPLAHARSGLISQLFLLCLLSCSTYFNLMI